MIYTFHSMGVIVILQLNISPFVIAKVREIHSIREYSKFLDMSLNCAKQRIEFIIFIYSHIYYKWYIVRENYSISFNLEPLQIHPEQARASRDLRGYVRHVVDIWSISISETKQCLSEAFFRKRD